MGELVFGIIVWDSSLQGSGHTLSLRAGLIILQAVMAIRSELEFTNVCIMSPGIMECFFYFHNFSTISCGMNRRYGGLKVCGTFSGLWAGCSLLILTKKSANSSAMAD